MSADPSEPGFTQVAEGQGSNTEMTQQDQKPPITFTMEEILEADDQQCGFCISCGSEQDCCEPDAREYKCEECGQRSVYGAEELVVMGRVN